MLTPMPFPESKISAAEQQLFRMSIDMLCIANHAGYFVHLNPSWERVLGWSIAELKAKPYIEFVHPDDVAKTATEAKNLVRKDFHSFTFANRYRHKDGGFRWIHWSARADHDYVFAVARDVTESKEKEILLRQIEHTAKIGGWRLNVRKMETQWTDEIYRIHEIPIGTPINAAKETHFYPPEARPLVSQAVDDCIKYGKPFDIDLPFVTEKRHQRWIRMIGQAIRDTEGNVAEVIGVIQDITAQKETKLAKAELDRRMDRTAKNSPGMIYQYRFDPETGEESFPYWSSQFYSMFRVPRDSISPIVLFDLVLPQYQESLRKGLIESVKNLSRFTWTGKIRTFDGSEVLWCKAHSLPEKHPDGSILFDGIITDITEQKRLEERIEEERVRALTASKLASLGEMAGGIAHEINNPLAIILGRAHQLRGMVDRGEPTDQIKDVLDSITETSERIVKIVQGMKSLLRNANQDGFSKVDLNQVIRDTLSFSEERLRSLGVDLFLDLEENIYVFGNTSQISQVVLNLLNNAADAVQKHAGAWIKVETGVAGDYVYFAVEDNGPAIAEDIQERIMEPFFTTKPQGKGSGLGLSISANIMGQHSGKLSLDKSVSRTRFLATFPVLASQT